MWAWEGGKEGEVWECMRSVSQSVSGRERVSE